MDVIEVFDLSALMPFLLSVLGAIILLIVTLVVARWAERATHRSMDRSKLDPTLAKFFAGLARYTVLVLGGLTVLSAFGISVASFAAILAAAGFAIGLALQGTLAHFSAGVMLLMFRPFKVGDVISVAGIKGKVIEIGLVTTQFNTPDNRLIIVPNGAIFGSTIDNMTHYDRRRVDISVGTDYRADLDATRAALERTAASVEGVLPEPAPQVYLSELGGSSIDWAVRVWSVTDDYWAVRERLTHAVKQALDEAGVGIPFPQMDVHLDGALAEGLQTDGDSVPEPGGPGNEV